MMPLLKRPSAFLPIAMSSLILALILVHLARLGPAPAADEGTEAHLFQIVMPAQVPIVAFFAMSWVPRSPKAALQVLAMQVGAALVVFATVFLLRW